MLIRASSIESDQKLTQSQSQRNTNTEVQEQDWLQDPQYHQNITTLQQDD